MLKTLLYYIYQDNYTVYEVSDWQSEEEIQGEAEMMYNYEKDGKLVLVTAISPTVLVSLFSVVLNGTSPPCPNAQKMSLIR